MEHIATLKPVFYGMAVKDIIYGSNTLHVKVLDLLPSKDGVVDTTIEAITATIETPKGTIEKTALFTDYIKCEWLNVNSNRITAPDVMYGQRVLVYRDGDSEDYYWKLLDTDEDLKTLEHVIYAFSNTKLEDRSDKTLGFNNCYILEFDTRNQKIGLYTNKNNGEPFAYDIKLDTKNGNWKLNDDVGNHLLLDSANTLIEFINKDKTTYKLDKKDIYEYCKGNKTTIVEGDFVTKVTGKVDTTVGRNHYIESAGFGVKTGNTAFDTGGGFDVKAGISNFTEHVNMGSFAAGAASAGSPPRGGDGYVGSIDGALLVTKSVTSPIGNFTDINCTNIEGSVGNFSSSIAAPNKNC